MKQILMYKELNKRLKSEGKIRYFAGVIGGFYSTHEQKSYG